MSKHVKLDDAEAKYNTHYGMIGLEYAYKVRSYVVNSIIYHTRIVAIPIQNALVHYCSGCAEASF